MKTKKTTVTLPERDRLCDRRDITLDGRPAKISGRLEQFATVATMDDSPEVSQVWAWELVKNIVANGGKFRS